MPPSENAAEIPAISTLRAMHALLCYAYPPKKMPEIAFLTSYPKTSMPFPYVSLRYLRYGFVLMIALFLLALRGVIF